MVTNTNLLHNSTKLIIIIRNRNLFHYKAKARVQKCRVHCYEGLHGYRHKEMDRRKRDQQREGEGEGGLGASAEWRRRKPVQ